LSFTYPQAQGKPDSGWEAQEVESKALVGDPWEPNPNLWLLFGSNSFYVNQLIILHNHATSFIISCDLVGACHKGPNHYAPSHLLSYLLGKYGQHIICFFDMAQVRA
jgi:hypothetical protein